MRKSVFKMSTGRSVTRKIISKLPTEKLSKTAVSSSASKSETETAKKNVKINIKDTRKNEEKEESEEEEDESEEEEEESEEEEEESEEEEITPKRKSKSKFFSSPSKRGNRRRETNPLIEEKTTAPQTKNPQPFIEPSTPKNIIYVVKTASLPKPPLDKTTMHIERYLTKDELEYIVDIIPMVPAAVAEVGCIVQQQIKNWLIIQLSEHKIIPLGIEILRSEIEFHFYKALVEPGKTIGITCSESVGQPLTQITLSSFHQTGSATAGTSGVDSIREMLNISPERKHETTVIHFKDKNLTFDEAFEMRKHISSLTLHDVVRKSAILIANVEEDISTRGWWYTLSENLLGNNINDEDSAIVNASVYLRLYLDPQKLYDAGVTTQEIATVIDSASVENSSCESIYSPTSVGVIDVYPKRNVSTVLREKFKSPTIRIKSSAITALNEESIEAIFLQRCIVNKMQEIVIKGVPGIRDMIPSSIKMSSLIRHAEPFLRQEKNDIPHGVGNFLTEEDRNILTLKDKNIDLFNTWKIWLDFIKIRVSGVPISKMVNLIESTGLEVLYSPPDIEDKVFMTNTQINPLYNQLKHDCIVVKVSDEVKNVEIFDFDNEGKPVKREIQKSFNPVDYIKYCIDRASNERDIHIRAVKAIGEEKNTSNEIPEFTDESKQILLYSSYVFVEANGINMKSLLTNPYVDPSRCRCNNFHYMMETFDIEVTRNAYIREFHEHIVNNGAFMNPRYLILIAEFVTCQGFLIPVTSRGVSRQNVGAFAKASFEHAMPTFIDAACFKKEENVKSTSTAIFTGRRCIIGSGLCQPIPDEEMIKQNQEFQDEFGEVTEHNVIKFDSTKGINFLGTDLYNVHGDDELGGATVTIGIQSEILSKPKEIFDPLCPKGIIPDIKPCKLPLPEWIRLIISKVGNINYIADIQQDATGSQNTIIKTGKPAGSSLFKIVIKKDKITSEVENPIHKKETTLPSPSKRKIKIKPITEITLTEQEEVEEFFGKTKVVFLNSDIPTIAKPNIIKEEEESEEEESEQKEEKTSIFIKSSTLPSKPKSKSQKIEETETEEEKPFTLPSKPKPQPRKIKVEEKSESEEEKPSTLPPKPKPKPKVTVLKQKK